jgi:ubiquinol-cytochrome c reductase cytochrome b subunit
VILDRLARAIDARLGTGAFVRKGLNKVFPDHWSFLLGEVAMFCFVILVLTGTFLAAFFHPSLHEVVYEGSYEPLRGQEVSEAYASVVQLSFDVRFGLLMRQIHHWAALIFVAAILLHLMRVFFTGAFRKPREVNWIVGLTLLILAMVTGFTGYTLPDDLLSGTGLRVTHSIILSIPVIGTWLSFLIFGGEFPGVDIIPRLFVLHILVLPVAIATLLALHLAILWRQKHAQFPASGRTETNVVGLKLWPHHTLKMGALFCITFAVLALLGGLVQINAVWLYGPFHPTAVPVPAQPDWYLGWVEGALRLYPNWEPTIFGYTIPNPFVPAVLMPGITFGLLYAWPFLEARFTGDRHERHLLDRPRDHPLRTAFGTATIAFYAVLFFAGSNDILAMLLDVSVFTVTATYQVLALLLPLVTGIVTYTVLKGRQRAANELAEGASL